MKNIIDEEYLLKQAHSVEKEDLIKTTAKLFEFNKISSNLKDKLSKLIEQKIY